MFKTEKDLVENIKNNLISDRSSYSLFVVQGKRSVFCELKLGYGVPDVVVTIQPEHHTVSRSVYLNHFDVLVLNLIIKKKAVRLEEVANLTRSTTCKVKKTLIKLAIEEFIKEEGFFYEPHKPYTSIVSDSIAIEAKLYSWKRALKQAYRYKWFSKRSFVFLPEENIGPAKKNLKMFIDMEVGLVAVSRNSMRTIYNPQPKIPVCETMSTMLNEHVLQFSV